MADDKKKQSPGVRGTLHKRMAEAVQRCRDVYQGTLHMRERGKQYLPKFPKEEADAYRDRLESAVLFNAFKRTVKGLVGMVMRKEPTISTEVPDRLVEHLGNVDLQGRALADFAADTFDDSWQDGHSHIFVDMQPNDPEQIVTLLDERRAGLRAYWIAIRKQDVIRFRTINVGGHTVLSRLAWREETVEEDGEFGDREVVRVRQYDLSIIDPETEAARIGVTFRVWQLKEDKTDEGEPDSWNEITPENNRLEGVQRIPLTTGYTDRTGFMESAPPLLDLALENIKHYQKRSDLDNVEHVASVPILALIGVTESPEGFAIGPAVGVQIESPDGDVKYAEVTGAAMSAGRESLKDIERRMAVLGLSQLMSETRAAETATSKRIDKSESDSALSRAATSLERQLNEALELHAEWEGIELPDSDSPHIGVNRDFEAQQMDAEMVKALAALVPDIISHETLWALMVQGEMLPETFDPELERERIEGGDMGLLQRLAEMARGNGGGEEEEEEEEEEPAAAGA